MSGNGDWRVVVGWEPQVDLFRFPWSPDLERGGCCTGRWETDGIRRVDDGRTLFVRRVFPSDSDNTSESVLINYDAIVDLETFAVPARKGSTGGRTGAADTGQTCGSIHSHPDQIRELSSIDIRNAAKNAEVIPVPAGRPYLSVIATSTERWKPATWSIPGTTAIRFPPCVPRPIDHHAVRQLDERARMDS